MSPAHWTADLVRREGYGRRFLWVDLVNSEYFDGFGTVTDYLNSESWRSALLKVWNFPSLTGSRFPIESFQSLRSRLRTAAEKISGGHDVSSEIVRALNAVLEESAFRSIERVSIGEYRLTIQPERYSWKWVQAQVVASFAEFLESGQTERLKICPNPECIWIFYDETRGGTKRWCNDRLCGNRDKVRRFRASHPT